jgi:uncharacterized phage protein (TIGR01671 family)
MREIKFRAWDKTLRMMNRTLALGGWRLLADGRMSHISGDNDRYVLMEFTGLRDKNDKEIYGGDILGPKRQTLKSWTSGDGERAVVQWDDDASKWDMNFYSIHGGEGHLSWEESLNRRVRDGWEVIGNIYENGDLLGGRDAKD